MTATDGNTGVALFENPFARRQAVFAAFFAEGDNHVFAFGVGSDAGQFAEMATDTVIFVRVDSFHNDFRLSSGMFDAKDVEFGVGNAYAAQFVAVAAQRLNGVEPHAAEHFFYFMSPGANQIC